MGMAPQEKARLEAVEDLANLALSKIGGLTPSSVDAADHPVRGVAVGSGTVFPGGGTYVPGVGTGPESVTGFTGVTGGTAIDGILYAVGQRLLVTGMSNAANGIWVVASIVSGVGVLARPIDWATGLTIPGGTLIEVAEGNVQQNSVYILPTASTVAAGAWTFAAFVVGTSTVSPEPYLVPGATNGTQFSALASTVHNVRGVVTANVASLAAFTVASTDLTFAAGDRALLTGQSTASQNGIYQVGQVTAGAAALTRTADWATGQKLVPGTVVNVSEGTGGANSVWRVITTGVITIDTTSVTLDMDNGNWVSANGITTLAAQTIAAGPLSFVPVAMLLKMKRTGLIRLDIDLSYSSNTTAHPVSITLISSTSAAGALTNSSGGASVMSPIGVAGFNSSGADHEAITTTTVGGVGVIFYNGAQFSTAPINQKVETTAVTGNATLTGLLTTNGGGTMKFSFHSVIYNAIGTTKTLFTVGNTVGVCLQMNATAADVITLAAYNGYMSELPNL